jgi:osmoprotectant transport system substrate-binding protein
MFASKKARILAGVLALGGLVALSACSSGGGGAFDTGSSSSSDTITVGSANFPESQILMEIYAQALEANGVKVSTKPNIGAREVYLKALQDGSIDLIPEYTGNLLGYYDKSSTAASSEDVYAALNDALPKGYEVLDQSDAQDADSYNVTKDFAAKWKVKEIGDLAKVTDPNPIVLGANPEFQNRPYGIPGLKSAYGVTATLKQFSDGGGAATQAALKSGEVQVADIYTTTPGIKDFVTLEDPKHLIAAQNIVPLINSGKASAKVKDVLNKVSAELTTEDLVTMNEENAGASKTQPDAVAKKWLQDHPIK